jgi:ribosomal-protein-alanine N-acetyltransferase
MRIEEVSFPNPYTRSVFTRYLSLAYQGFLVAEQKGGVVGYIIAEIQGTQGLIVSLAVLPEYRKGGIGSTLMREALERLCKVRRIHLQVSVENRTAIEFYRKFSFHEMSTIKNYYPNGDDAILMVRDN